MNIVCFELKKSTELFSLEKHKIFYNQSQKHRGLWHFNFNGYFNNVYGKSIGIL